MKKFIAAVLVITGLVLIVATIPVSYNDLTRLGDNVVMVTQTRDRLSGGTGFILEVPGHETIVISNAHVCEVAGRDKTLYLTTNEDQSYMTRVLYKDENRDLCAIRLPYSLSNRRGLLPAAKAVINEQLFVIGYPLLDERRIQSGHLLKEEVIELGSEILGYDEKDKCEAEGGRVLVTWFFATCLKKFAAFSTEALIYPGNSGSPVLNVDGEVIGVIFAGSGARGFAVPLGVLYDFLNEFHNSGSNRKPTAD